MNKTEKLKYCIGCTDNFYNGQQNIGGTDCWSLAKAKLVTRFKIGWWTAPTEPFAFTKVKTLNCHREPGKFAFGDSLPDFVSSKEVAELTK